MTNSNLGFIILSKPRKLTVLECLWSVSNTQSLVHRPCRDNVRLLLLSFLSWSTIGNSWSGLNRIHFLIFLTYSLSRTDKPLFSTHLLNLFYGFFSLTHILRPMIRQKSFQSKSSVV